MYEAKIIADSITKRGHRLTTMQWTFPRIILAEVNTTRMFGRNSASSRAIPVQRRIDQIIADPFVPAVFGKNQRGMQSIEELKEEDAKAARLAWLDAIDAALGPARRLVKLEVHKQWANRVIETYAWHTAVITATEWSNHDGLRVHPAASPEYFTIAKMAKDARDASIPYLLEPGEWHLPYVINQDRTIHSDDMDAAHKFLGVPAGMDLKPNSKEFIKVLRKVSVGRCASVSYERQEEKNFTKDVDRYGNLRGGGHMSPFEHPARPMTDYEFLELFKQKKVVWDDTDEEWKYASENGEPVYTHFCGNLQGWIQDRKMIPNEDDFSKIVKTS